MTRFLFALLFALPLAAPPISAVAQAPLAPAPQAQAQPENAFKYLQAAGAAFKPYKQEAEPTPDIARGIIADNAPVFALLERAVTLPLRFEKQDEKDEFQVAMQTTTISGNMAQLLSLRARVQAEAGDLDGALGSGLLCVSLGLKMQEDGGLIPLMRGNRCEATGLRALEELAAKLSPKQLKAAARRLLELEATRVSFGRVLSGQREEMLRLMGSGLAQGHGPEAGFGAERQKAALGVMRETMETEDALLSRPFPLSRGLDFALEEKDPDAVRAAPTVPELVVGRLNAPAWAQSMVKMDRPIKGRYLLHRTLSQADLSLLAAALATRAYRLENKAAPASLQVLVPNYLPALPLDPFELDTPLQFKSDAEGVRIYSVGPDGMDDGGRAIEGRRPEIDSSGDILAPPELLKP